MPFRYNLPELRESNESLKRFRIEINFLKKNEKEKEEGDRRMEYTWENLTMTHICVVFGKRNTT